MILPFCSIIRIDLVFPSMRRVQDRIIMRSKQSMITCTLCTPSALFISLYHFFSWLINVFEQEMLVCKNAIVTAILDYNCTVENWKERKYQQSRLILTRMLKGLSYTLSYIFSNVLIRKMHCSGILLNLERPVRH